MRCACGGSSCNSRRPDQGPEGAARRDLLSTISRLWSREGLSATPRFARLRSRRRRAFSLDRDAEPAEIVCRTMLLIRHSDRANNAVRAVSPGGELFVASVVIFMILVSFGDAVDPALFGEAGLEFGLFDLGGEFSVLAMPPSDLLPPLPPPRPSAP